MLDYILGLIPSAPSHTVIVYAESGGGYLARYVEDEPGNTVTSRPLDEGDAAIALAVIGALKSEAFFTGEASPDPGRVARADALQVFVAWPYLATRSPNGVEKEVLESAGRFLAEKEQIPPSFPFERSPYVWVRGSAALREAWFRRRFPGVLDPIDALNRLDEDIAETQRPLVERFQGIVASVEGKDFGSLEANRRVTQMIQDTADSLRQAFVCPKCGQPGRIQCSYAKTAKNGMFTFTHSPGTHGGRTKMPKLTLTAPAVDGRKAVEEKS